LRAAKRAQSSSQDVSVLENAVNASRSADVVPLRNLSWARRRLRGFVTERLRGVTSGERELREEMRRLWT
jgi:hypothetical protein